MVSFFKYRHKNHNGGIIVNLLLHKNAVIINYLSRSCMEQMYECRHCWRMSYWYQHVSAGQIGAGTNVPVQQGGHVSAS